MLSSKIELKEGISQRDALFFVGIEIFLELNAIACDTER
jgi:hypothetical protein